jgi:hypothetical protein
MRQIDHLKTHIATALPACVRPAAVLELEHVLKFRSIRQVLVEDQS